MIGWMVASVSGLGLALHVHQAAPGDDPRVVEQAAGRLRARLWATMSSGQGDGSHG